VPSVFLLWNCPPELRIQGDHPAQKRWRGPSGGSRRLDRLTRSYREDSHGWPERCASPPAARPMRWRRVRHGPDWAIWRSIAPTASFATATITHLFGSGETISIAVKF